MKRTYQTDELTDQQLTELRQFRLIYGSVKKHFRAVERACEIFGSQLWILREIAASLDTGLSRLAERLSIHQSTCSLLVEKDGQR
ncbi:MAG: hypothetical protein Q7T59_00700 [Candidatus Woesebacteria bacterium]|nr:hypothetical protein [Candidatus Woesebacteria bacterium]